LYGVGINRWKGECHTQGGGVSAWLCASSESRGVAILLSKHFVCDINFNFSDKTGRLLKCEIKTDTAVILDHDLCLKESKNCFLSLHSLGAYIHVFEIRITAFSVFISPVSSV
jgi:hypothetical protein